jgi:hypothetical protein
VFRQFGEIAQQPVQRQVRFFHVPVFQAENSIGYVENPVIVRHEQNRAAHLLRQVLEQFHDFAPRCAVQ